MIYLNFRKDYLQKLPPADLELVLAQNPLNEEEALMDIEALTASTLSGYLNERYDLSKLTGRKYRQSTAQLQGWAVTIAAYLLFDQAGLEANEDIQRAYEACMEELQLIKDGGRDWLAPVSQARSGMQWLPEEGLDIDPDDSMFMDLY